MNIKVKICGLSTEETVRTAVETGASYIGFVFYPPSPRNINPVRAAELAHITDHKVPKVGVFVNPDDSLLTNVLNHTMLDIIQLHGSENVERVKEIQKRFSPKVMKAIKVAESGDIEKAREFEDVADMLLFDAKAPKELKNALPGGNGLQFDWNLIARHKWDIPWMLSGGLNVHNIKQAVNISGAQIIDISSGVENEPGHKDINKIKAFMSTVQEI